jgi:hypothetical protein
LAASQGHGRGGSAGLSARQAVVKMGARVTRPSDNFETGWKHCPTVIWGWRFRGRAVFAALRRGKRGR